MKVCHFIASKGLGRGEAYIDLVNALCGEVNIVLLIPRGALYLNRVGPSIKIVEYTSKDTRLNPLLYAELYRKIRTINPDIVHTHFAKASEVFYKLNKFLHLPHVATKHNPRKGRIYNKLPNVIAVSKAVKTSVNHDNVTVIYNGLTVEPTQAVQTTNQVFTICAVGRLDKIKGYDILIRACAELQIDFNLQLAGDGEEREPLESLAREVGIEDRVTFLGFRTDIPDIMAHADLIVMSSHSEGCSISALEAVFYGKVFISTAVGNAPEVLPDRFLTNHASLADKIGDIVTNYDAYSAEFDALRETLKPRFLLKNIVKEYHNYYETALSQHRSTA